jgi:hypothetical protein
VFLVQSCLLMRVILLHVSEYCQLVGALQYCTLARPEIAYSINQLCQFMHKPHSTHWTVLKRVLRYLKSSIDHGLYYCKGSLSLQAFCDFDWAGDPDNCRSTSGFGVYPSPCLVSWCAKKQSVVSKSSTETEYRAMVAATAATAKQKMVCWGYKGNANCLFYHGGMESRDHLFFSCSFNRGIWRSVMADCLFENLLFFGRMLLIGALLCLRGRTLRLAWGSYVLGL